MCRHKQNGFTIVEVGIVVPILVVVLLALSGSLYFTLRVNVAESVRASSAYDIQETLSILERDVSLAVQFLSTKDASVTDAYPPSSNGGTWSYTGQGPSKRALILQSYATTDNPDSNARQPVFLNQLGCTSNVLYFNDVLVYNTFYFILNNNLYRRRALKPTAATCSTPYQLQSCPSLETLGTGSRDASCNSDDELILKDVSQFSIDYYDASNDTSALDAYDVATGPTLLQGANALKVTITTNRTAMGKITPVTSSLVMSRINLTRTGN